MVILNLQGVNDREGQRRPIQTMLNTTRGLHLKKRPTKRNREENVTTSIALVWRKKHC